ncbi:hypothetical protein [Streptomyces sp. NPDC001492]
MKITGNGPHEGGPEPVRTTFLHRAADVARIVGAIFEVVYYALKIW